MKRLTWHKRDHAAALDGYMGLTLEERGVYTTLLDLMYDRGGPLPDREPFIAGHLEVSVRKYRSVRDELLRKGKLQRTDEGYLTNGRMEKEVEGLTLSHRTARESGAKGGRTRVENEKKARENNGGDQGTLEQPLSSRAGGDKNTLPTVRAGEPAGDPIKAVFDTGVAILVGSGMSAGSARSLVGRWRAEKHDPGVMLDVFAEARDKTDPRAWITAALAQRAAPAFDRVAESRERYSHLPTTRPTSIQ